MPYASTTDLFARLAPDLLSLLADDDGDAAPDTAILTAALDDASAQIDAALARRYAVPIDPAPDRLVRLAVDLAVAFLYRRRREALPAEAAAALTEALLDLVDLADGTAALPGVAPQTSPLDSTSTTLDQPKRFDRDTLKPF